MPMYNSFYTKKQKLVLNAGCFLKFSSFIEVNARKILIQAFLKLATFLFQNHMYLEIFVSLRVVFLE